MSEQRTAGQRGEPETHWFRVEVSDRDGQVVAIEPGMLAGREIGEKEDIAIRKAIEHLQGFIGAPLDESEDEHSPPEPDGECFRGGEAAAYEAEQMARIQRELK